MGYYRKVDTATNLLPYSQDFNPAWLFDSIIVTDNVAIAPDGTMTAASVEDADGTDWQKIRGTVTVPNDTVIRCASIYVRKESASPTYYTRFEIVYDNGGTLTAHTLTNIDLFTGYYEFSTFGTPGWKQLYGGVEDAGDYWRLWIAGPNNGTGNVNCSLYLYPAYNTAAATNTVVVWGGQLEVGSEPTPYIYTNGSATTAAVRRDNHWAKDHNGIWRRHLKLEGPRNGYSEWTNLIDYSAGPFNESPGGLDFWDTIWTLDTWENVASCIEGGRAVKATSTTDGSPRYNLTTGTYSGEVEVMSGIFERVDSEPNRFAVYAWGNPSGSHQVGVYVNNWSTMQILNTELGNGTVVDSGWEDLGIGPNGGQLIRLWCAYDSGVANFTGETRWNQWRLTNEFSGVETGIMHHAQLIQIPSGYSSSDNGAPTGPIVNLGATNNSINRESFRIPITFDPQPITVYSRFQQKWRDGQHSVFAVGGSGGAFLYVQNNNGTGGTFFGRFNDGTLQSTCIMSSGSSVVFGDTVELVLTLYSDGHVKGWTSVNGGTWTTGTDGDSTPTIPASWGNDNVWVNGDTALSDVSGFTEIEALKIVDHG